MVCSAKNQASQSHGAPETTFASKAHRFRVKVNRHTSSKTAISGAPGQQTFTDLSLPQSINCAALEKITKKPEVPEPPGRCSGCFVDPDWADWSGYENDASVCSVAVMRPCGAFILPAEDV